MKSASLFFRKFFWIVLTPTLLLSACVSYPDVNVRSGPTTRSSRAVLRGKIAYAPRNAPLAVKRAIWAGNALRKQPYRFSGGHRSFMSKGYDCSGTVSFVLHYAGLLATPDDSRSFLNYGESGAGEWITVYARDGHSFIEIAGLRLDTSRMHDGHGARGPRWRTTDRAESGFVARHPAGL